MCDSNMQRVHIRYEWSGLKYKKREPKRHSALMWKGDISRLSLLQLQLSSKATESAFIYVKAFCCFHPFQIDVISEWYKCNQFSTANNLSFASLTRAVVITYHSLSSCH